jgi:hypothetical protein
MSEILNKGHLRVDSFKLRLWLAMQESVEEGVRVKVAAETLDCYGIDQQKMREDFGWAMEAIDPFSKWRASESVYSFPSLSELRSVFDEAFEEVSITYPRYYLGECCPIFVLRPRS